MIETREVSFAFRTSQVLDRVSIRTDVGKVIGLVGPNGSGKTTLLRTMYAALQPSGGAVQIDGAAVGRIGARELARRIAVVSQESPPELPMTVADMVLLGRAPSRSLIQSYGHDDHVVAAAALTRVNARQLADRNFATLSGGEKQRVLIARALAQQADHLLLDEPTNHLDLRHQHELLGLVRELDTTSIVVLHDLNLAARYCDHILLLHRGRVIRQGTPAEVFTPDVLEPIYAISVEVLHDVDCIQLLFRPNRPAANDAIDPDVPTADDQKEVSR